MRKILHTLLDLSYVVVTAGVLLAFSPISSPDATKGLDGKSPGQSQVVQVQQTNYEDGITDINGDGKPVCACPNSAADCYCYWWPPQDEVSEA